MTGIMGLVTMTLVTVIAIREPDFALTVTP